MEAKGGNKGKYPVSYDMHNDKPITSLKTVSVHKVEDNAYTQHSNARIPPKKNEKIP
jgi:hypothetical protein